MIVRLALAFGLALVACGGAEASRSCRTHAEARAAFPRAYLYWSGGPKGERCWSDRRRSRARDAQASVAQPTKNEPPHNAVAQPTRIEPPRNAPSVAQQIKTDPPHNAPGDVERRWPWVEMGSINPTGVNSPEIDAPPFSTFEPGTEPDVWPILEQQSAAPFGAALAIVAVLIVLGWRYRRRVWVSSLFEVGVRR